MRYSACSNVVVLWFCLLSACGRNGSSSTQGPSGNDAGGPSESGTSGATSQDEPGGSNATGSAGGERGSTDAGNQDAPDGNKQPDAEIPDGGGGGANVVPECAAAPLTLDETGATRGGISCGDGGEVLALGWKDTSSAYADGRVFRLVDDRFVTAATLPGTEDSGFDSLLVSPASVLRTSDGALLVGGALGVREGLASWVWKTFLRRSSDGANWTDETILDASGAEDTSLAVVVALAELPGGQLFAGRYLWDLATVTASGHEVLERQEDGDWVSVWKWPGNPTCEGNYGVEMAVLGQSLYVAMPFGLVRFTEDEGWAVVFEPTDAMLGGLARDGAGGLWLSGHSSGQQTDWVGTWTDGSWQRELSTFERTLVMGSSPPLSIAHASGDNARLDRLQGGTWAPVCNLPVATGGATFCPGVGLFLLDYKVVVPEP